MSPAVTGPESTRSEAYFVPAGPGPHGGHLFEAQPACVGPWAADSMHGGPPSALLVRCCEQVVPAADGPTVGPRALRATVDFLAPVPVGPVEVLARVVRPGRRIALAEASMRAGGREVLVARTWLVALDPGALRRAGRGPGDTPDVPAGAGADPAHRPPPPQDCPEALAAWSFPYARSLEWRLVSGDAQGPGDAATWARQRVPVVPGEEPSGLQRAVLVADSGNGISAALDWGTWSFVNIDLDVRLSRPLVGDWVLLDATSRYQPTGTGLATSVLSDRDGVVGVGAQTLLVSRRPGT